MWVNEKAIIPVRIHNVYQGAIKLALIGIDGAIGPVAIWVYLGEGFLENFLYIEPKAGAKVTDMPL